MMAYKNMSVRGCRRMQGGYRSGVNEKEDLDPGPPFNTHLLNCMRSKKKVAGWVARTRPLAEPLSPRGPQPVLRRLRTLIADLNGTGEPLDGVLGS